MEETIDLRILVDLFVDKPSSTPGRFYKDDWNLLIPVVQKIGIEAQKIARQRNVNPMTPHGMTTVPDTPLGDLAWKVYFYFTRFRREECWQACIAFIEAYNESQYVEP